MVGVKAQQTLLVVTTAMKNLQSRRPKIGDPSRATLIERPLFQKSNWRYRPFSVIRLTRLTGCSAAIAAAQARLINGRDR
jgi:hypothetical protein